MSRSEFWNEQETTPSGIRLRAFPLGLLAPRLLGVAHLPRNPRLLAGARVPLLFGGRKSSFPQRLLGSAGLAQPSAPTPILVCISTFLVKSYVFLFAHYGAHPLFTDARRGNARRKTRTTGTHHSLCLPHPPCAHETPHTKPRKGFVCGSLSKLHVPNKFSRSTKLNYL